MGKRIKTKKFTVQQIAAWAEHKAGLPVKLITKQRGKGKSTIYRAIKEIDEAILEKIDIEKLRKGLALLFPEGFNSLQKNLKRGNPQVTIAFFKGMGIFKEEIKHDVPIGQMVFGDIIINQFADNVLNKRKEESNSRDGVKASRFSDSGNLVSPN
ncbi:MAG: hypothetical protein ACOZAL_03420 [Patescibacteria group bacterium]